MGRDRGVEEFENGAVAEAEGIGGVGAGENVTQALAAVRQLAGAKKK